MDVTSDLPAIRLLLVEDSVAQARFIQQTLRDLSSPQPFDVAWVESLEDTLDHLAGSAVDLVLLDLVLPDSDGIDTFDAVHRARPEVPVIVLSGAGDESTALRAVGMGAQDYLTKSSMSPELLTRSIRYALERHRNLAALRRLALTDELTGVHNRRGFLFLAEQQLAVARRASATITVLFADVDGLKRVNDTYGHQEGDRALVDVATLLRSTLRSSDIIGRIGGDEFCAMLLDDGPEPAQELPAAARFLAAIDAHNTAALRPFALSCSVGVVTHKPTAGLTVGDLLWQADSDMYDNRQLHRLPIDRPVADGASPHPKESTTR